MDQVYVFCPYGTETGGPEALHQLVYYINKISHIAKIVYIDIAKKNKQIPSAYKVYVSDYLLLEDIVDNEDNIIICPETTISFLNKFEKCKKYIWWLSVDNNTNNKKKKKIQRVITKIFDINTYKKIFTGKYSIKKINTFIKNKNYVFDNEDKSITHLCASYYAYDYVSKKTKNKCLLLIEPISLFYLQQGKYLESSIRKDVVLYNPAKNYKFTKKIVKKNKSIKFLPLKGYSQKELLELYRTSKLYIDFGTFPGAERIPKEAVYNGCVVITGKNGASKFYEDVPLPESNKIESKIKNIPLISKKIIDVLRDYPNEIKKCSEYVKTVDNLESNFIKQIQTILFNTNC